MAHDLVIKNGTLVDGTGAPARRADVAITGGTIAEIGRVTDGAARVIDAGQVARAACFNSSRYGRPLCSDAGSTARPRLALT